MATPTSPAKPTEHLPDSGARRSGATPKILAKACQACRTRKIRCDTRRPQCSTCVNQGRRCEYAIEAPRKRPTFAKLEQLQREVERLSLFIRRLKVARNEERSHLLDSVDSSTDKGRVYLPDSVQPTSPDTDRKINKGRSQDHVVSPGPGGAATPEVFDSSSDEEPDLSVYACINDAGETSSFGPSSALNNPHARRPGSSSASQNASSEGIRNALIANAALQRQQEARLRFLPNIEGVPTELALHLLNVHWSRQHHTFLLTYRPAIMRDIAVQGPSYSPFLINAIFACSSKFSPRAAELHGQGTTEKMTAKHFFHRCDQLLADDRLLTMPSIPTVVGLVLLGSSYNAIGQTSKGWLYTGYALRMVYDLGLHLDPRGEKYSAEEIEIRRRVFWGAFICDKLQGLYLGRPTVIDLRDAHVLQEFNDTYEENEIWTGQPEVFEADSQTWPMLSILSVSTFKQFGLLSRIMTRILNHFYVVGASRRNAGVRLKSIDTALQHWQDHLPTDLILDPSGSEGSSSKGLVRPPNILNLHAIFHSLVILLHRPFISDGHLRSLTAPEASWRKCSSAAWSITQIATGYRKAWTLKSAPYLLSYAIYVACTIHVRNAATRDEGSRSLLISSMRCLEELCAANPGVHRPLGIIKKLMTTYGLSEASSNVDSQLLTPTNVSGPPDAALSGLNGEAALDLDSIFSMFPSGDGSNYDPTLMQDPFASMDTQGPNVIGSNDLNGASNLFELNNLDDALYGHMNGQILPWQDADYDALFAMN